MQIREHIESRSGEMAKFLGDLVRIATVNPPGEKYRECVEFLDRRLKNLGFESRILAVPTKELIRHNSDYARYPRYNILAYWDTGSEKTIHFNAHYDVVPVSGSWTEDPFSGAIRGGQVHGRGSADMKGSIAAYLNAVQAIQELQISPAYNLEISFVCDEETGGHLGARYLTETTPLRADYVIVGEGAHGKPVGVGHNGVIWLKVSLHGQSAHASRPADGKNAFEATAQLVSGLEDYRQKISERSFDLGDGRPMRPTLCVGGTFGQGDGAKTNIVPSLAWFTLDRRVLPNENIEEAEAELIAAVELAGESVNARVEIDPEHRAGAYFTDPGGPLPKAFSTSVSSVLKGSVKPFVTPGFTDARFFGTDLKLPTIGYGPGGVRYHAPNEAVSIDALLKTSLIYADFLSGPCISLS